MTEHNNPPAFPVWINADFEYDPPTLLDHFAGLAMQGLLTSSEFYPAPDLAVHAYQVADAMLKERAKWIK